MNKGPTKICSSCGERKSLDLFYQNSNYHDKRDRRCKICKTNYIIRAGIDVSKAGADYLKKYISLIGLAHSDKDDFDDYIPAFDERGFLYVDGECGIGMTVDPPDLGAWGK